MHPGAAVDRLTLLRSVVHTKLGPAKVRNRRIFLVPAGVRRRSLHRTHIGRSPLAAATALDAPFRSFAAITRIGEEGMEKQTLQLIGRLFSREATMRRSLVREYAARVIRHRPHRSRPPPLQSGDAS